MDIKDHNKYNNEQYNKKKNIYHRKLAFFTFMDNPILFATFLPILLLVAFMWLKTPKITTLLDIPQILLSIIPITIRLLLMLVALLLVLWIIDCVGMHKARQDEGKMMAVFNSSELRNGCPVLYYKKKQGNKIIRKWYSPLPMSLWRSHQEDILDYYAEHYLGDGIKYVAGAKDNCIQMETYVGRETTIKDKTIDVALEKDMEKINL